MTNSEQLVLSKSNGDKGIGNTIHTERILRFDEVHEKTGLCRSQCHALAAQGRFPKPLKLVPGGRASGWLFSEIQTYLADRVAERDAAAKCGV